MSRILCKECKIYKMLVSGFAKWGGGYPEEPKTLGDRIRVSRLDRGLLQREVAEVIGVKRGTINKWECNRGEPRACDVPRILGFLGYDPSPKAKSFPELMKKWRLENGLSARAASSLLGVGSATWAGWERGVGKPTARNEKRIRDLMVAGRLSRLGL